MHIKRPLLAVISRLNEVHIEDCDLLLKSAAMGLAWICDPNWKCRELRRRETLAVAV